MTLATASQVIGFISFSVTLLTLLGVYSDLIKTLRSAPSTIPLALGNLREEIQYEQFYLKYKLAEVDRFNVFPELRAAEQQRRRKNKQFVGLIDQTLRHIWREFCDLERAFIMKGETPWTLSSGNYQRDDGVNSGGDYDDEKGTSGGSRRRRRRPVPPNSSSRKESFVKNKMGFVEAGLSNDRGTYYNTDLAHRFWWWWKAADFNNVAQQLQRLQVRRIERDVFEVDELVRRSWKRQCTKYGWSYRGSHSSGGSDSAGGGGGGSSGSDGGGGARSAIARRRRSIGTNGRKRRSRRSGDGEHLGRNMREVSEREVVRRPARNPERSASVGSRSKVRDERTDRRSVVYEYEVVDPGRIHVEYEAPRRDDSRQRNRHRSYSRERD